MRVALFFLFLILLATPLIFVENAATSSISVDRVSVIGESDLAGYLEPKWSYNISLVGVQAVDLDGDGYSELLVETFDELLVVDNNGTIRTLYAFDNSNSVDTRISAMSGGVSVSAADLDGDGLTEIMLCVWDTHNDLVILRSNGSEVLRVNLKSIYENVTGQELDVDTQLYSVAPPVAVDFDGDSLSELLVSTQWATFVFDDLRSGFTFLRLLNYTSEFTSVVDFDGDGSYEYLVGAFSSPAVVVDLKSWDVEAKIGNALNSYYLFSVDLDRDGNNELLAFSSSNKIYLYRNGSFELVFDSEDTNGSVKALNEAEPAFGDIDVDGKYEIVFQGIVDNGKNLGLIIFDDDLSLLGTIAFNRSDFDTSTMMEPILGDIDGDYKLDIVVGFGPYIWAIDGQSFETLDIATPFLGFGGLIKKCLLADIDADGQAEVITYFKGPAGLVVFDVEGKGSPWPMWHHDVLHTSLVEDSDKDLLADYLEEALGLDPSNPDTDGDGLSDGSELLIYGTNPFEPSKISLEASGTLDEVHREVSSGQEIYLLYSLAFGVIVLGIGVLLVIRWKIIFRQ